MPIHLEDADLLRALLGERSSILLAGIPVEVLLDCDQPVLRRAGLDRRSAARLVAAGRIARMYGPTLANTNRAPADLPGSLVEVLSETGFLVFEELIPKSSV